MSIREVTVLGASGFVGRYVVKQLAEAGYRVRAASRDPERALHLRPMGEVGQIVLPQVNLRYPHSIEAAVDGADAVINLAGLLYQKGAQSFEAVHVAGARAAAAAAGAAGVERFIQMSAIGADAESGSAYGRSKAAGEAAVRDEFADATIVRPSIIFGPEDDFFNRFAGLARLSPVLPLIGGGQTRFQPVYVGDVAAAIRELLAGDTGRGGIYELGGPRQFSFEALLRYICAETGRSRTFVPLPFWLAKLEAAWLQLLPRPLLTIDQVEMLKTDNVVSGDHPGLESLAIAATPLEAVTPAYLSRYRRAGRLTQSRFG